jgi:hypothetical protein
MRHFHTDSPPHLANAAFHDPDGYVETLLERARNQLVARRRHAIALGRLSRLNQARCNTPAPSILH